MRKIYKFEACYLFMEQKNIITRLDRIEKTLKHIQEKMIDVDSIISENERIMLDESVENEKAGKLVSLEVVGDVRNKVR